MTEIPCTRSGKDDDFQRYLGGGMTAPEEEAFEQHYFECGECFEALENHRAIRGAVVNDRVVPVTRLRPRPSPRVLWGGLAAAAVLVLAVSVVRRTPAGIEAPTDGPAATSPGTPAALAPQTPALAELARFDPPPYHGATSRAAETDAGRAFRAAMTSYQAGAFADAARQLRAAGSGAQVEETRFFLGISELQAGEADAGIADLRAVVAMGDTAYFEEAAYFLAKALLGREDVDGSRQLLERLVGLRGDRAADAARLLERVRQLPPQ